MRLAALYSHPSQYAVPLFRELSGRPGIDFHVFYMSRQGADNTFDPGFGKSFSWDIPVLEGYRHSFIPNLRAGHSVERFFDLMNVQVLGELRKGRYDALLVHGYEHFAKWLAFLGAGMSGTRIILRGESHLALSRKPAVRIAKQVVFSNLFRGFHAFAYVGSLNREYYKSFGVDDRRLHFAPYSVDNDFFRDAAARLREKRDELRRGFGVTDNAPVVLFSGKLCARKQPEPLLRAFAKVRSRHRCHLLFAGDGELRAGLESLRDEMRIPDVHFAGFLNQSAIPGAYAAADLFVLPSTFETWGLVINEAMAAGLPVIATDSVGCSSDLIQEGVNGFVVPRDGNDELADRIEQLVVNPELRESCARQSARLIDGWSISKTADGIVEAAQTPC